MKSRLTAPALVTAAILAFAGITAADAATSAVKLCLYPPKGTVRQVSSSTTKCSRGEKLLVLGTTGPRGPEGPSGIPGEVGPQGPRGLTGPAGPTGPAGTNGTNGNAGPRGFTGLTGPAGATGATGPTMVVKDSTGAFVGYLISTELNSYNLPQSFTVWLANSGVIVKLTSAGTLVYTTPDLVFTTSDCTGTMYVANAGLVKNKTIPITDTSSATVWTTTNEVVVADATTLDFNSSWSVANGCQASSIASFAGPQTVPNVFSLTSTTSPLPSITGPLTIGIQ